ncbi:hypothetical protein AWC38_SpisGene21635 [Stylophora pistillata]|uniref:AMP-binding enzyme C-terminal domain-containing protein n=1 Tax=Stylophora pistillata TaxID=50429 RepID=A0A2B4RD97_STYPI|nr:hypothetical protein AWC38_SpisGene21635 [Stylophora pistillata]
MRRDDTNTKEHNFIVGDYVLLKQKKVNKWSTAYEPIFYTIIRISGSTITARRVTDRREICRDSSHSKLANAIMHEGGKGGHCEDWRETLLVNTDSADQSSEEWIQSQGEQLQPRDSPEHRGSIEENALNQSPKDANLQSKDYQPLAMTPAQDTLRPCQLVKNRSEYSSSENEFSMEIRASKSQMTMATAAASTQMTMASASLVMDMKTIALYSAHFHIMTLHHAMSTPASDSTQMTMASASLGMEMKTIALSSAHSHSSPVHADKSRPSAMTTVMPGLHNFTIQMTMATTAALALAELEALLISYQKLDDAAVIGVPDEESGELPKAFVVPKGEITPE